MRFQHIFTVLSFLLLAATLIGEELDVPEIIESEHRRTPIWASPEVAFDDTGNLNPDLYEPSARRLFADIYDDLASRSDVSTSECLPIGRVINAAIPITPLRSISESALQNDRVIRMRVLAHAVGLDSDRLPSTIFQVQQIEALKGEPLDGNLFYLSFPVGDLEIRGVQYCKSDPRFPDLPEPGDAIIIFLESRFLWHHKSYLGLDPEPEIIILRQDESVELAPQFEENLDSSLQEPDASSVLEYISTIISQDPR